MNRLNGDCANLIFERVSLIHRFYLARTLRINSLVEKAKRDTFRAKYGEFTQTEKGLPLEEVIRRVRFNMTYIPYALALRVEEGLLLLKFDGEIAGGEICVFEIDQINKKVGHILNGINNSINDFSAPATLAGQKNIIRRRYHFKMIFNHYKRLYQNTAIYHRFSEAPALGFMAMNEPPIQIASCGLFSIYGSYLWDNRYEFYIREGVQLKCSFTLKINLLEISCVLPRIVLLEECHLVMVKVVAAIFFHENRNLLSIRHRINFIPILYEAGLWEFNLNKESTLKDASKQAKHLFELLNVRPQVHENEMRTTISKIGINIQMYEKIQACFKEISLSDFILADHI